MRYDIWLKRLIAVCCTLAILLSMTLIPVSASAEAGTKVTASTNASVKQGNSAYCYNDFSLRCGGDSSCIDSGCWGVCYVYCVNNNGGGCSGGDR